MTNKKSLFDFFNYILLSVACILTLYPLYYVLIASISGGDAVISGKVLFYPVNFTFDSFKKVLELKGIFTAYANTIYYAVVGTIVSLIITILGAYPLSRKRLVGRRGIGLFICFTMWFNAGIIPVYLNFSNLGLDNTRLGIIIGFACSAFYVIIMRSYFEGIPDALEEAAKIDGMSDFGILIKIILPMSTPVLATVGLYYMVERWNGYFWAMILLKDESLIPLQVLLKKLVVESSVMDNLDVVFTANYSKETIIYATIMVAIIPIICVYPLIQRYLVKGMMLGAVKG